MQVMEEYLKGRWSYMRKMISKMIAVAMVATLLNGGTVNAAEQNVVGTSEASVSALSGGEITELQSSSEELEQTDISESEANVMERDESESQELASELTEDSAIVSSESAIAADSVEATAASNTDPNNAYIVTNDTVAQETINATGEARWYAFVLNEKSKVAIQSQMVEALDVDLYVYVMNTETYQLEMIGGSATDGMGVAEYYNSLLDAGTYFFAIEGYQGSGNFAFGYYESTVDVSNEINDSVNTATNVDFNTDITGVIDNPNDVDYYTFTVTKPTVLRYSILTSDNYSLEYAASSGTGAGAYGIEGTLINVNAGTYYFKVKSPNGNYSSTNTYTINFKKIVELADDSSANLLGVCEENGIVFQTNSTGSKYYVNGNSIDINYSYINNFSNSAGSQSYKISLEDRDDVNVYLNEKVFEPSAVYYLNSTKPNLAIRNKAVLELTFISNNPFYKIHCVCSGAYKQNTLWQDLKYVTVLVDPDTGKLIDISNFNYFYEFAPVGSNSITFTRPYTMKYNYDLEN
jgi:hypothetical protein